MKYRYLKIFIFGITLLILAGCAKSVRMKYAEPEARTLCEENFYRQFHTLVSDEEEKEFKTIKTLSECREFLDRFWQKRDTDPRTPQNEFKEEMEKRAQFIESEGLFQRSDTPGISFGSNGGFFGAMANVYMLHGIPDYMEVLQNGRTFVDMMLWIYLDESQERHKYRFLFYQKGNVGAFQLFRPIVDPSLALLEVNKSPMLYSLSVVYDELQQRMGWWFLESMIYFSDDFDANIDEAMQPPKTASEIAKEASPNVQGKIPQKNEEIFSSGNFNSTIPAELSYFNNDENWTLQLLVKYGDLDWILKNEKLAAELFVKITVWSGDKRYEKEETIDVVSTKEEITSSVFSFQFSPLEPGEKATKITVYIKNNNKYNSWIEDVK